MSLAVAALLLSGLGIFSAHIPASAQVDISPGTDESNNMTSNDSGVRSSTPTSGNPRLIAADIAQTNSLQLDSDVKNLVILIPDKRLITQGFLPLDATIVEGTKVIWVNGDKALMAFHYRIAKCSLSFLMKQFHTKMEMNICLVLKELSHFRIP